jgi:hypothetical protein
VVLFLRLEQTKEQKMSELWKNEGYFATYQEAHLLLDQLVGGPNGVTLQVKIKRCGLNGSEYVVKSRTNPELKAAVKEVEEQMLVIKEKKAKNSK